ncbi:MAG: DUF5692 family protein [Gemmataceae bacterium]
MPVFAKILIVTLALPVGQELLRRSGRWPAWCLFLALPAALASHWIAINDFDWFQWVKVYTVFFCVVWGTALRFTTLGERPWAKATIPLLLGANILEAVARDAFAGGFAHLLNAAAGLVLVAAVPYGSTRTWIDSRGDLLSATSRTWILGYTTWNWTFVYLNYPALAGHHVAVLAASLFIGLYAPHRWTQVRAHTLGLHLFGSANWYPDVNDWLNTTAWTDETGGLIAAGIAFAIAAAIALTPASRTRPG